MWAKFLAVISLLLVFPDQLVFAEQILVGPVYSDQPGEVSVVVELPPGVTPEASDFRLLADGKIVATARQIMPFRLSGQGLALVLCVDVSGTMKGDPLADTKRALLSFLGRARPEDHIALVSFADEDKIESSFEETREYLAEAVRNLQTRGKRTGLYQALYKSLDTLQSAKLPKRRRIIVISDGKDEGSAEGPDSVIAKSRALGIPIDAVGRGKIEKQYAEALRGLANTTGGRFVHARPDIVDLTDAIARIYRDLLETRSRVVCFMYETDNAGRTTQNALIELQRSGESPLRVSIPEEIPRIKPSPDWLSWLFWLLLVALLGIGLVVLVRRRLIEKKGKGTDETEDAETAKTEIKTQTVVPPTQVSGYRFPVPEPGQPTAILIGVSGPVEGQHFSVEKELFHIGASPENDLYIAEDNYVSGNHAYIRYERGSLLIFDMNSRNGTLVNQDKVTDTGLVLSLGDRIHIGMSMFEVTKAQGRSGVGMRTLAGAQGPSIEGGH